MKKVIMIFLIVIIYFLLYFLQVNFFNWFTIAGVKPNLFVILVLIVSIYINKKVGAVFGFLVGMYNDFLFSNTIGISAILLCIVGISGEFLEKKFSEDSRITMILMSSIVTVFYEVFMYVYSIVRLSIDANVLSFSYILAIEVIYNALLLIICYPLIQKFGAYVNSILNNKVMLPRYF